MLKLIIILIVFPVIAFSECCSKTSFYFKHHASKSCFDYPDSNIAVPGDTYLQQATVYAHIKLSRCMASTCGDGKHHDGVYCGIGGCNIFGCNCDGGCIPGNAKENFLRIHGVES